MFVVAVGLDREVSLVHGDVQPSGWTAKPIPQPTRDSVLRTQEMQAGERRTRSGSRRSYPALSPALNVPPNVRSFA